MDVSSARSSFPHISTLWHVFKRTQKSTSNAVQDQCVVDSIQPNQSAYILSLPPEILMDILILSASSDHQGEPNGPIHNIPLHLVQICAPLRSLALRTPELWSSITISLDHTTPSHRIRSTANLADTWLAKGRPGTLKLRIVSSSPYDHPVDSGNCKPSPLLKLITAHAHDWRSLALVHLPDGLTKDVVYEMTEQQQQHSFDSLEEIEIHAFTSMSGLLFSPVRSPPRLRVVHLRTTAIPTATHDPALLFLPWQRLSSLRIAAPVMGSLCLENLVGCVHLTLLELYIRCEVPNAPSTTTTPRPWPQQVELPTLTHLALTLWCGPGHQDGSSAEFILRKLTLPALEALDLCFIGKHTWTPLASGFWNSHAAQLRGLTMSNLSLDLETAISVFETLTELRALKLVGRETRLTAAVFDALRKSEGGVLPRLERMELGVVDHDSASNSDSDAPRPYEALRSVISFVRTRPRMVYAFIVDWTQSDEEDRGGEWTQRVLDAERELLGSQTELRARGVDVRWRRMGSATSTLIAA